MTLRTLIDGSPPAVGVASCVIGLVLVWSGGTKLRDPNGTASAIAAFGIGQAPRRLLALLLGSFEFILGGVAIAAAGTATAIERGAVSVASVLFVFFVVLMSRSLLKGQRFPCHCFGSDERPFGFTTVLRTALLGALTLWAAFLPERYGAPSPTRFFLELVTASASLGGLVSVLATKRLLHFNNHLRQIGGGGV